MSDELPKRLSGLNLNPTNIQAKDEEIVFTKSGNTSVRASLLLQNPRPGSTSYYEASQRFMDQPATDGVGPTSRWRGFYLDHKDRYSRGKPTLSTTSGEHRVAKTRDSSTCWRCDPTFNSPSRLSSNTTASSFWSGEDSPVMRRPDLQEPLPPTRKSALSYWGISTALNSRSTANKMVDDSAIGKKGDVEDDETQEPEGDKMEE